MSRRFIVVAIVAGTCFVSLSPESEAFHRRRGKHGANRHCATAVAAPISACDTGCAAYAPTPISSPCGCSAGMSGYGVYNQPGVYGTTMNSQSDLGVQMTGSPANGNVGAINQQVIPQ